MSISTDQKLDYLWKKVGYGAAKRDINSVLNATQEGVPSPLLLRGDNVWAQSGDVPGTMPASSSGVVTVYPTTNPIEVSSFDSSARDNRFWNTGQIDWIPPELGSTYVVKVYIHTSGDAANAAANGTQVFSTGSGNNDEWFFDYQAGTLNFIGDNLPNGINFTGKSVYISGARYTGTKGVSIVGAAGSFSDLFVTGISTFVGQAVFNTGIVPDADEGAYLGTASLPFSEAHIDEIRIGVSGNGEIDTASGNLILDSAGGTVNVTDNLDVDGTLNVDSTSQFDGNVNMSSNLTVASILDVNGRADIDNVRIDGNTVSTTSSKLILDSTSGEVEINDNLDLNGSLNVNLTSVFQGTATALNGFIGNLTGTASRATTVTTANSTSNTNFRIAFHSATSGAANLLNDGGILFNSSTNKLTVAGAGSFGGDITAFASDERLKTNISPITDALFKVNSLNGFTYNFNEIAGELGFDTEIDYAGVSAQEVQKVLPEIVRPAPIDDKYITVQYDKLTALLIEAVKELSDKVEKLEQKLSDK